MWLGSSSIITDINKYDFRYEPGGAKMKWVKPDQLLRSLGTRLTIAGDTTEFWKEKLETITKRLNNWRDFYPSLIGKILISKLSLYSCIWYYTQNMVVPTFVKKILKKTIARFIWKNKNEKQTYDQKASRSLTDERLMAQETNKGGLKALHLESEINAFAAKWISRYLLPSTPVWKDFITYKFNRAISELPLKHHPIDFFLSMHIPKKVDKNNS